MELCLRIALLLLLVTGTLTQDGFDLADALGDLDPTPAKPKDKPNSDGGLDLSDAFGPDEPTQKPKKPSSGDSGGLDLEDAFGADPYPKPDKPAVKPPHSGGGGGNFDLSDLDDVSGGDYKPEGGRPGGGGASDQGYDQGGADQPQDPDLLWGHILKMLNANMPEEVYMWISNLKQTLTPLIERAVDLLRAMP